MYTLPPGARTKHFASIVAACPLTVGIATPVAVPIVPRATLVLGRRLPVRVEAATGMGEMSLDSVPIFNFIQHVRARRLRTQTVGGLHGAT